MAKPRSAGDLFHSVAFDKRVEQSDGAGNTKGSWQEQFQRRAGYINVRGGEAVMADRLEGQRTQVIFVRACSQSKTITPEWRVRDTRTGVIYNVREVTATIDRLWIDILVQSGVAV
ncbi:head-tail adaptor protein [Agrobacterium rubi]|uniref:head-tail adaptor protein n=1 Tax=Agrobacterium rubi TaxID=28099 RepID=UPI001573B699|nr:head-tail adaptor protein [Agrobacterium rubi]NTF07182.1 head-tail adaptor protein [Agrobacterium rubi]NTF19438.1 head-tail adaptor protein [Agrobacterium rubi]NTF26401.1 head-tail adaptor protein [Agrobacterium rubi]